MEINLPETENLEISPFERLDSVDRKKLLALHVTRSALEPRGFIFSDWGFPPWLAPWLTLDRVFEQMKLAKANGFEIPSLSYLGHPAFWTPSVFRIRLPNETMNAYVIRMWEAMRHIGYYDLDSNTYISCLEVIGLDVEHDVSDRNRFGQWLVRGQSGDELLDNFIITLDEYQGVGGSQLCADVVKDIIETLEQKSNE